MIHLSSQPFLLSLRRITAPGNDLESYQSLLKEQQSAFKLYLEACCHSDIPAPARYEFLKNADYELCSIRMMNADAIREKDFSFYRFWSMMIVDTRRFISVGIKTLDFQRKCPAHMLAETHDTFPPCKWISSKVDLSEAMVGLFQVDAIRLQDGSRPPFALFVKIIGGFFGITYDNPYKDIGRVINRKKDYAPFLHRMIECLKDKKIKMDE